MNSMILKTLPY